MWVLLIYVVLIMIGGGVAFGAGAAVSNLVSDPVSLPVFLGCYFLALWLSWVIAVRIAESLKLMR